MKKLTLLIVTLLATSSLIGCNTVNGIGEDLGAVGGAISNTADNVKNR
ncbi:MAG: entericidin B [Lysobacterales bacterium]|jgi:entericidin B